MTRKILSIALLAMTVACGKNSPTAPAPITPDCQLHNTGTLILVNQNVTARGANMDGAFVGAMPSNGGQLTLTVAAGVAHKVEFLSAISGLIVSTASPIVTQCGSYTLTNTF
jgi:hypothetical protein